MTEMKVVYLVCGPPGSGKTTFAKSLGGELIEVDNFPGLYDEKGKISLELLPEAHRWCKSLFREAIERGVSPLIHTIIRMESPNTRYYVELAEKNGYRVKVKKPKGASYLFYDDSFGDESQIRVLIERRGPNSDRYVPEHIIRECCASLY